MDKNYYSDKTINNFIRRDICQNDKLLLGYYQKENVKKFRNRLNILKVEPKALEQAIYVYITDAVRDIILAFIGKLTKYLRPFGDLIISGGEAFNYYFTKDDRIVTSDIDTKFIPIFRTEYGKLVGPSYYKYFGYLQALKLIIWDYLGKNCKALSDLIYKRLHEIKKDKIAKMLGISLSKKGPYVTRRYTLIRKSKQSKNNSKNVMEGNVLIDVELFALDLNLRYYSTGDRQIKDRTLGGILDIAIMRPFEIGFEVVYSRQAGHYYTDPVTQKVTHNKDILMAGKKFLVEDLYILKSLGLRPKKKVKDRKRMLKFSKLVNANKINSQTSDEEIFKKTLNKINQNKNKNKINLFKRPSITTKQLLSRANKVNPNQFLNFVTPPEKRKAISQYLYGLKGPRNTNVIGFSKTSGPFIFNTKNKKWKPINNSLYIRNEFNFRPDKKIINNKINISQIPFTSLYSYISTRNNWIPQSILQKAAILPFIGLKK